MTPKACVGEHRWRIVQAPANDYVIIAGVEKERLESHAICDVARDLGQYHASFLKVVPDGKLNTYYYASNAHLFQTTVLHKRNISNYETTVA